MAAEIIPNPNAPKLSKQASIRKVIVLDEDEDEDEDEVAPSTPPSKRPRNVRHSISPLTSPHSPCIFLEQATKL
jgi:hypothetical protein